MPFKSKAQQRFMFAAESRGEVPKGTAERWAKHTPDLRHLPEKAKKHDKKASFLVQAFEIGRRQALQEAGVPAASIKDASTKEASLTKEALVESGLGRLLQNSAHLWAPAAVGYYMAGPENGHWGALAGLGAGALGSRFGKYLLRSSHFTPEELSIVQRMKNMKVDSPEFAEFLKSEPKLGPKVQAMMMQTPGVEWAGRLGGAAGAGYLLSRSGRPGVPASGGSPTAPGYYAGSSAYGPSSYGAPAVTDMGSHYLGLTNG